MSKIKNKETKPEVIVRKYLFSRGFRYRKNDRFLPGTPDIVLPKFKTVIFIHGCFWHGHAIHNEKGVMKVPMTRTEFWQNKIMSNIERDHKNIEKLQKEKWKVIVVWSCELKNKANQDKRLKLLVEQLLNTEL